MENGTCTVFIAYPTAVPSARSLALEWLCRPYRLCRIEMPLVTGERTYVRLNPARQTPTLLLEDGRVHSAKALAILQHLATRGLCRNSVIRKGNRRGSTN